MAVITNIRGTTEVLYEGCVLRWYEVNGVHDSDWFAVVWDDESQSVRHVEFMTTRAPVYGKADIDITPDNLRKAYQHFLQSWSRWYDHVNAEQARKPECGKRVRVMRGRKVNVGTEGVVFWIGESQWGMRAGIRTDDGQTHFVPLDYLEVVNPDQYLADEYDRQRVIREKAMDEIPQHLRGMLDHADRELVPTV